MSLPWNPSTIIRMVKDYTAMQGRLALVVEERDSFEHSVGIFKAEVKRLRTDLAHAEASANAMQKLANSIEMKHHLAPPAGGVEFPLAELEALLPARVWQRTDDPLLVLSEREWDRFLAWVAPIARYAGYYPNKLDCDDYLVIALGRATEWATLLAKGGCYGRTKGGTPHAWGFVFALVEGKPALRYFDLTPRSIVPAWGAEGLAAALPPGWWVEELLWL